MNNYIIKSYRVAFYKAAVNAIIVKVVTNHLRNVDRHKAGKKA